MTRLPGAITCSALRTSACAPKTFDLPAIPLFRFAPRPMISGHAAVKAVFPLIIKIVTNKHSVSNCR